MTPALASILALLAGIAGFRLEPDSSWYASGHLYPSPLGGLIGLLGGMPLLVLVSAAAAGGCFALLPSLRARARFALLGGFWLVFPGVDALGTLLVALTARSRRWWPLAAFTHLASALAAVGLLLRRRPLAYALAAGIALMAGFTLDGELRDLGVPAWEHLLYTTRYLIPAGFLYALRTP